MKYSTFKKIYYDHRLNKANKLRYILLIVLLPFVYLLNKIFDQRKINLDNLLIKKPEMLSKDLNYLFEFFGSDKGEKFINQYQKPIKKDNVKILGHDYAKFYEKFFKEFKNTNNNILEIGAFRGNASAAFFFYFKNANIYSYDIFPDLFCYRSSRNKNYHIDNSSEKEIEKKIIRNDLMYDIIIEDAGHYYKDQIITLFKTFSKINSNGLYVVEELDFPDTRKDMNIDNQHPTLKEILISIKSKRDFSSKLISNEEKKYFLENYNNIEILKGRENEICFIRKK